MSNYRLKTPKKVETAVTGSYKKIENNFVETFLEKIPDDGRQKISVEKEPGAEDGFSALLI